MILSQIYLVGELNWRQSSYLNFNSIKSRKYQTTKFYQTFNHRQFWLSNQALLINTERIVPLLFSILCIWCAIFPHQLEFLLWLNSPRKCTPVKLKVRQKVGYQFVIKITSHLSSDLAFWHRKGLVLYHVSPVYTITFCNCPFDSWNKSPGNSDSSSLNPYSPNVTFLYPLKTFSGGTEM